MGDWGGAAKSTQTPLPRCVPREALSLCPAAILGHPEHRDRPSLKTTSANAFFFFSQGFSVLKSVSGMFSEDLCQQLKMNPDPTRGDNRMRKESEVVCGLQRALPEANYTCSQSLEQVTGHTVGGKARHFPKSYSGKGLPPNLNGGLIQSWVVGFSRSRFKAFLLIALRFRQQQKIQRKFKIQPKDRKDPRSPS